MKIALVRGDFAAPSEFYNFQKISKKNKLYLFTGKFPVWNLNAIKNITIIKLFSPVDLNLGKISLWKMAILNRIFTDAHLLLGLEKELKGFDIAHSAETYFNFTQQCIEAKKKGYVKKVVSSVWENIAFNNEGIAGRKEFKKNAFKNVDLFLALTEKARKVLIEEGCSPKKIKVLKLGIDTKKFSPGNRNQKSIKLLFVGRLIPEKGIIEIINMFKNLSDEFKNLELIISGEGILRDEVERKISEEKLKKVRYIGKVEYEKMPDLYKDSDIFIHYPIGSKTWNEQYGMVLIEALSCGLPIVALNKGSIGEVIENAGIITSQKQFKEELRKIISDKKLRNALSRKARKHALENYDSSKYAEKIEKIYNEVLKS